MGFRSALHVEERGGGAPAAGCPGAGMGISRTSPKGPSRAIFFRMKTAIGSALVALSLLFGAGCASTSPSYYGTHYPDSNTLRANVKTALWQDPAVAPF